MVAAGTWVLGSRMAWVAAGREDIVLRLEAVARALVLEIGASVAGRRIEIVQVRSVGNGWRDLPSSNLRQCMPLLDPREVVIG